jgi:hypothetical protein
MHDHAYHDMPCGWQRGDCVAAAHVSHSPNQSTLLQLQQRWHALVSLLEKHWWRSSCSAEVHQQAVHYEFLAWQQQLL